MAGDSQRVDVDPAALTAAARVFDELRGDFAGIAARATEVMGNMTAACGDDHFGHQFTDGDKGYKKRCTLSRKSAESMQESFAQYDAGVGGAAGAGTLMSGTDHTSGVDIARSV